MLMFSADQAELLSGSCRIAPERRGLAKAGHCYPDFMLPQHNDNLAGSWRYQCHHRFTADEASKHTRVLSQAPSLNHEPRFH